MRRCSKTVIPVVWTAALLLPGQSAQGQPQPLPRSPTTLINARPVVRLSTVLTNGNVLFSWQPMPGRWELQEQQPAFTGNWKPLPAGLYQTNGMTISASVPLPAKTSLYRLKRSFALKAPTLPDLPPVPPLPTNRPPLRPPRPPAKVGN